MFAKGLSLLNVVKLHKGKIGQVTNVLKRADVTNTD